MIAGRGGEVVTREEIQREIWGSETFVDFEHGVNHCIKQIRKALRDSADTPRYVETLPRRGYRFISPVEEFTKSPSRAGGISEGSDVPKVNSASRSSTLAFIAKVRG
jgi:DNA-binding winged helix-turn-helix (wHTH) protein